MRVAVTFHISSRYILEPYTFHPVPHLQSFSHLKLFIIYLFTDALYTSECI